MTTQHKSACLCICICVCVAVWLYWWVKTPVKWFDTLLLLLFLLYLVWRHRVTLTGCQIAVHVSLMYSIKVLIANGCHCQLRRGKEVGGGRGCLFKQCATIRFCYWQAWIQTHTHTYIYTHTELITICDNCALPAECSLWTLLVISFSYTFFISYKSWNLNSS